MWMNAIGGMVDVPKICHNVPGGFVCLCEAGFNLQNDSRTCVNEGDCHSTWISFPLHKCSIIDVMYSCNVDIAVYYVYKINIAPQ